MTKQSFVAALNVLADTFNRQLSDGALEGYWIALGEVGDHEMAHATRWALRSCKFMPAPAELLASVRAYAQSRSLAEAAETQVKALREWMDKPVDAGKMREEIRSVIRELADKKALED